MGKYPHLRVKPENPEDEERLAALERMSKGEDVWLDARSVMLYLQMGRTKAYGPSGSARTAGRVSREQGQDGVILRRKRKDGVPSSRPEGSLRAGRPAAM